MNDKITLRDACELPVWLAVWATEPNRHIDVEMTYSDLKCIFDWIHERIPFEKKEVSE